MRKPALLSTLLLGAALISGGAASAQPRPHDGPARAWHGPRPVAHNRFVFHNDFRHFTPVEHRWWVGGHWRHAWWHGHWGWWWGVGGAWYFYNAPVYPYPTIVSPTYYDDDYYGGGDDQGYGDGGYQGGYGGGPGVWYHCSSPEGFYPYIKNCHSGWEQVPATPGDMQGGPPPGGPGGPGGPDMQGGPPPGGPGGPDDYGPPPNGPYPGDQNEPPPPGH